MSTYAVLDNNYVEVFTGRYYECEEWISEFGWNNEAHYSIRAVKS